MQKEPDKKAQELIKKFDKAKSNRVNWDRYWKEISEYFIPRKSDVYGAHVSGQKKEQYLYDSTSVHAAELLASALHGMLTNPSLTWFGLTTGDEKLDSQKRVREWLQTSVQKMIQVLNNSNFQTEIHELYLDLVNLGTALMSIDKDDRTIVSFKTMPVYEAYLLENSRALVDSVFSENEWTVKQIVDEFGEKVVADKMPDLLEKLKQDPECKEKLIHMVFPRNYDSNSRVPSKMRFASITISRRHQQIIRESGFRQCKYVAPRWTKISGEVYGRSPAMKCLSDVKTLNVMMKSMLQATQLRAFPPVLASDEGLLSPVRFTPGGATYTRGGTRERVEVLNITGDLATNDKIMNDIRQQINKTFFIDQLQLTTESKYQTATEVNQRTEEQLRMLSPILGRLHNELLKPIIDRVFEIMLDEKQFGEIPQELGGRNLQIQYTSQISKAQRVSEADVFPRLLGVIAPIAQAKPEILDNINGDELLRYYAGLFDLPSKILYDKTEVDTQRDQRAMQMQKAQQMAMEQHDAEVSSKVAPNMLEAQKIARGQ